LGVDQQALEQNLATRLPDARLGNTKKSSPHDWHRIATLGDGGTAGRISRGIGIDTVDASSLVAVWRHRTEQKRPAPMAILLRLTKKTFRQPTRSQVRETLVEGRPMDKSPI
jgi:hypothetical protein